MHHGREDTGGESALGACPAASQLFAGKLDVHAFNTILSKFQQAILPNYLKNTPTHNLYWGIIPVNCSSIHVGRYQNRFRAPKDEKKFRGYRQVYVGRQSSRVTKMGYNPDASQYQIYLVDESKGQVIG